MKIVQFAEPGPPSVLKYVDAPIPDPKPGEVLVRAHSIGVGIPDINIRKGTYGWMPDLPCTPGTEMSGTIEKLGPGVTERKLGQRVIVTARERPQRGGCYAEYIATAAEGTFIVPDGADMEAGATLANYQVAYHLMKDGARARPGDSVLVWGAAGGMGNALIDIAKADGLMVIGVASGADRCRFAKDMGADHVIDRKAERVPERVMEITQGRGVDIIVDPVAGDTIGANVKMLAVMGMLLIYGGLGGREKGDQITDALRGAMGRCPAIRRFSIHYLDHMPEPRRAGMRALLDMLARGQLKPRIGARLKLSEAAKAHEMMETSAVMGKLILQP
jgi:NADPH2:quinone reductase